MWNTQIKVGTEANAVKGDSKKISNNDSEAVWQYRKTPNRKYTEPENTTTISIEYEQGSKKKDVVVMGGLYLGSASANTGNVLADVNIESTHTLVLLGNLFDSMSADAFHDTPSDITQVETVLAAQSEHILARIRNLAEEVNVYYMRSSFDCDLTRVAIERLLGDKVNYIQQTNLVLALKQMNESYRVLLTTGQQWDFLHDVTNLTKEQLLLGKPIGHYLARAASTNPTFSVSSLMRPVASAIPVELSNDFLELLSKRPLQDRLTERMLTCALQLSQPEDLDAIKCLVDEGKYISIQSMVEYPYLKYLLQKVGLI